MTGARRTALGKEGLAHILRAAAGITGASRFVMVGSGAAIAQLDPVPDGMMMTREADIYVPDVADPGSFADLIDGSIGEGSQFDLTFGYHAHGVDARTALLPRDWLDRARSIELPTAPGITCICPDINDLALSKTIAWRDKDKDWIRAGLLANVLDLAVMAQRAPSIDDQRAPPADVMAGRLEMLGRVAGVRTTTALSLGVGPGKGGGRRHRSIRAKDTGID